MGSQHAACRSPAKLLDADFLKGWELRFLKQKLVPPVLALFGSFFQAHDVNRQEKADRIFKSTVHYFEAFCAVFLVLKSEINKSPRRGQCVERQQLKSWCWLRESVAQIAKSANKCRHRIEWNFSLERVEPFESRFQ